MSTEYNYDEQVSEQTFEDPENTAPRIHSDFEPPHTDLIDGQKRKQKRRERKLKRMIAVAVGYLLMGYMVYLIIVTAKAVPKIWDPYDILGISRSANERQIKTHYRKLSLTYHPDKIRPNLELNETIDYLNERFSELTKAFKALTDEEVRNNYIQYGHPDGKQSFSMSIALPKFLISDGNGKYVLAVYGLLLGVLLPYVVGKWWYGTQSVTKEGVLVASAGNLFKEYDEKINEGGIVHALSSGEEFKEVLVGDKAEYGLAKIESRVLVDDEAGSSRGLTEKERKKLEDLESGVRRKALGLIWAYLGRIELEDPILEDEKFEAAPIAYALNESFTAVALAYCNTEQILSSFRTTQNLIQAMPPNSSPLLQLPHITERIAQAIEGVGSRNHMTVQQFMGLKDEKRRKLAVGQGLLTEGQYRTALTIAKQLPLLNVEKVFFKVMGERFITPGSLVQFVIKARIIPPGSTPPEVSESDLEDIDPEEGDLDALHGRKKKAKTGDGKGKNSLTEDKPTLPPLAHAPYFARDHSPRWFAFLADSKQGKMVVPPFIISAFDKELFDKQGNQTFAMQTLKMQFQAPPQAGEYSFVMHLLSDSYVGMDTKMEVTLKVDETAKAEEMAAEDDISEPDEDSLAGQMNALKTGGGVGGGSMRKSKKKAQVASDDDDESNTEGEEETSETDTDTDTDTDEE
ncbi:hypothetical protein FGG08_002421 [Glutinoglossum americanum]|uniref:J domain-containing protein n=1 Tax=Glutinoglossum americanum TaxID=1670608 RepID=A0A9P8I997_9PEZI|nr:hypothetical protein FGG08_002421 [Glutinoglossum americanum]